MVSAETILKVRTKYESLAPLVDERVRRCWAAAEAKALGWGGVSAVAQATGLSRNTIQAGIEELEQRPLIREIGEEQLRVRRPGGGRKPLTETDPGLLRDLKRLLNDSTRGDPQSPLKWTIWIIACSPIAKPKKEPITLIAMTNLNISTDR